MLSEKEIAGIKSSVAFEKANFGLGPAGVIIEKLLSDREEIINNPNAALIAASPDMLEALKAIVSNAREGNGLDFGSDLITDARAAIAKAEGR